MNLLANEVATESVEAIRFSLLTDEDVRKHSFLKITEPQLLDGVGAPLPGGLYDPVLGPLLEKTHCTTCGQLQLNCPGHFGHIDLVSPVYNPLLFNFLYNLIQRTCFFCHHFRAARSEVEKCVSQLGHIIKGDIVAAKRLDSVSIVHDIEDSSDLDTAETHALSAASPEIGGTSKRSHRKGGGQVPDQFKNQKDLFSGPLLPSEAKNIVKDLWENEAELCSFISDMQQLGFGKTAGQCIFFLETVLVPPTKFRLPSKGGDSVMEHPQTVLLSKVLQCNMYLGNAHANNSEHAKTIARWMDLQQSINVVFDGKNATGQGQRDSVSGICQLLEKKEGLFRQKMMGKRVNYACRSVISPDPYLAVNEIGIPPYFALKLTYPEV
ncbi:hypothetical protein Ddye_032678 [Dipteronia dyeriana]|uniref:DNA-directed RNA polymerase subunit n=1 Tax=Dipteronia dyeriana TaxID=168575 RepID=A0AAD9TCG7_9ROSI|nr:hypothetical protein Ddye_032678 [Dipteronia dyeriana]